MKAEVIKSIHYSSHKDNFHTLFGGDDSNPTWEEYLDKFKDEFQPFLIAVKEAIERESLIGTKADMFCNNHHFKCDDSDKTEIAFSWRAWGDLMQAIVGKREGYMAYYM